MDKPTISIPAHVFDLLVDKTKWPQTIRDIKFDEGFTPEVVEVALHAVVLFQDNQGYYPMGVYKDVYSSRTFFVNEEDKDKGYFSWSCSFFELYRMSTNPNLFDKIIYYRVHGIRLFSRIFDRLMERQK